MSTIEPTEYKPDVALPPGLTILEKVREKGMTQTELAERMGRPLNKVNEIVKGKRAITPETAQELEFVLGFPAHFWLKLEADYQLAQRRLDTESHLREESKSLNLFPMREMIKLGWLEKGRDDIQTTLNLLKFFGIASFANLKNPTVMGAVFRKSQIKEACNYALAAWLRNGEIEAEAIKTSNFDGSGLVANINKMRSLSLLQPDKFIVELTEICLNHGIAVVLVPHLPKSYASGASYWVGDKAVIQLSLRFRTNDHFWFSFFHELGHILLHGKNSTFIDDFAKSDDDKELQANNFSGKCLIPPQHYDRLKRTNFHQASVVTKFADEIGIAPGIVVGRLQHDGLIGYNILNSLKIKFIWAHEQSD